jgi:antitoxin PrlF
MKKVMSKISIKGQTTIPQEVREKLGVKAGDLIQYSFESNHLVLRKFSPDEVMELMGMQRELQDWLSEDDDGLV